MNPEERHEDLLSSSTTALRSLTISSETADRSVRDATESLAELLTKVTASREARSSLAVSERAYHARNDKAVGELHRVDQEIVAAKVGAVELFEERDQVRRDLARARAALAEIKEFESFEATDIDDDEADSEPASLQDQADRVQDVEDDVNVAIAALNGYESELLTTSDELDELKMRKEILKARLKKVQGEW